MSSANPFHADAVLKTDGGEFTIYRLQQLADDGLGDIATLPYSIRVLLESCLRNCDGYIVSEDDVKNLAAWDAADVKPEEIPFKPGRVVLQDFTGVPAVVRPGSPAVRDAANGGRSAEDQPARPVRSGDRSQRAGRRVRHVGLLWNVQRRDRIPAQRRNGIEFLQAGASRRFRTSASFRRRRASFIR